jgi:hypothetical protein
MRARSFSELLQPIPNAAAVLQAVDEKTADRAQDGPLAGAQLAQYHHHHHHHWWRWHRHHHHHHHHYY